MVKVRVLCNEETEGSQFLRVARSRIERNPELKTKFGARWVEIVSTLYDKETKESWTGEIQLSQIEINKLFEMVKTKTSREDKSSGERRFAKFFRLDERMTLEAQILRLAPNFREDTLLEVLEQLDSYESLEEAKEFIREEIAFQQCNNSAHPKHSNFPNFTDIYREVFLNLNKIPVSSSNKNYQED